MPDVLPQDVIKQQINRVLTILGWATIEAMLFSVVGWGMALFFMPLLAGFILLAMLPARLRLEHRLTGGTYNLLFVYGLLWVPISIYATGIVQSICESQSTILYPLTWLFDHYLVCSLDAPVEVAVSILSFYWIGGGLLASTINFQDNQKIPILGVDQWFLAKDPIAYILGILSTLVIFLVPVILYLPQTNTVIGICLGVSTAYLVITHRYRHFTGLIASVVWAFVAVDLLLRSFLDGGCLITHFIPILSSIAKTCDLHEALQPVNSSMLRTTIGSSLIAYLVLLFMSSLFPQKSWQQH